MLNNGNTENLFAMVSNKQKMAYLFVQHASVLKISEAVLTSYGKKIIENIRRMYKYYICIFTMLWMGIVSLAKMND